MFEGIRDVGGITGRYCLLANSITSEQINQKLSTWLPSVKSTRNMFQCAVTVRLGDGRVIERIN